MTNHFTSFTPGLELDIELLDESGIQVLVPGTGLRFSGRTSLSPRDPGSFLELRDTVRSVIHEAAMDVRNAPPPDPSIGARKNSAALRVLGYPSCPGTAMVYLWGPFAGLCLHPALCAMPESLEKAVSDWAARQLVPTPGQAGLVATLAALAGSLDPDDPYRETRLARVTLPFRIHPPAPESYSQPE